MQAKANTSFTGYEKLVIFILAISQFTVILDFMVMSPLGDLLIKSMDIGASSFGVVVSAYAFSAGISGMLTAGFADKYDRKKLLLFFYSGFIIGTIFCGIANSFYTLVAARIITGLFGGVIGSISMAIITDLFALEKRGRVMGFVQMGFGASQVLGIPIGLYIANKLGWEAPFLFIAGFAILIAVLIALRLKPVTSHLVLQTHSQNAFKHLTNTLKKSSYRIGFLTTAVLSVGGFMMMPYGTVFAVNNLQISHEQLPFLFMASGLSSLVIMPLIGKLSDRLDKNKLFAVATVWLMIVCIIYTNLSATPFLLVLCINILMMIGIMSRMVPSTALISAVPEMQDRGAFMSINASLQQVSGGIAAVIAGLIVYQYDKNSPLEHYNIVGYTVVAVSAISIFLMTRVNKSILAKNKKVNIETEQQAFEA
ncbi:major facilitator superfamily MFS_1 [Pseudopedobacter saltans DSM 12145]|uniref:Major facilitator superfamily MFS_1 n=1 Tax=Pseudopedobacter saltans (strain ATCC 51119 / DSM 12145 / JCM 21818 / CCUG 39354 / LMG 10337 / NBRC 100064 / NCIMB 13643) TaxID=762903 RepID=F0SCG7_PSESL|nr:MFS transporter [Pseudopedobacter saltans]ADY52801.1 major facilitator superfamily MFS_1 [Pseudopedobacter saltans DSM 12145]